MKHAGALTVAILTAACASGPPDSSELAAKEYGRDNARIEAVEKFEALKRSCARAGGSARVYRSSSGRLPLTTDELQLAACGGRPGAATF